MRYDAVVVGGGTAGCVVASRLSEENMVDGVRWNAGFAYLDPVRGRDNLTILGETLVDRVVHDGERASAVVTSRGELEADTVVLTASAYGAQTEELDRVLSEFGGPLPMGQATIARRDGELFLLPALDEVEAGYEISGAAFDMKPRSRGRVRLNGPDPETPLAIEHGFLSVPEDADVVAEGIAELRELAASAGIRAWIARETRPGVDVTPLDHVRATACGFFHPVGTCALGAVAEPDGRVRGFENLYVADASFVPEPPRSNTNLTVAAVAAGLAEGI